MNQHHTFIYMITFDNQQVRSWKLMRASTIFCLFNVLECMMNKNLKCFNSFFFTNVVSLSLYMIQTRKLVQQRLYHLYFLAFVSLFLLVVECCSSRFDEHEGLKELGLVGACKFCYDGSHGLFIPWQISITYIFWYNLYFFSRFKLCLIAARRKK